MKSSCISHDKREPLIIIRKSYVDLCSNNHCAAALISYFEYWHNIKLDMQSRAEKANAVAVNHGDEPTQDTSLLQFHTADDLVNGMVGLFKIAKIREAIELLKNLKIISVHKNPNPRYKFDNTRYFLFNPDMTKKSCRHNENDTSYVENDRRSVENDTTITEIPSETSTEVTTEYLVYGDVANADTATKKKGLTEEEKEANKATWEAYASAYKKRYGVEPLRNAQVNGIISKFVKTIGQENAPNVARYYINLNNQYYVTKLHDAKTMLADACAIHTQWLTRTSVSATQARQQDKEQAAKSAVDGVLERRAKRLAEAAAMENVIDGEFNHV